VSETKFLLPPITLFAKRVYISSPIFLFIVTMKPLACILKLAFCAVAGTPAQDDEVAALERTAALIRGTALVLCEVATQDKQISRNWTAYPATKDYYYSAPADRQQFVWTQTISEPRGDARRSACVVAGISNITARRAQLHHGTCTGASDTTFACLLTCFCYRRAGTC
jgi:hypothetical protein